MTTDVDGAPVQVTRSLGTESKQVARAKLRAIVRGDLAVEVAGAGETFEQAARRVVESQKESGARAWEDRLSRLETHIFPVIGDMRPSYIRARHLRDLLEGVVVISPKSRQQATPARQTLLHILTDISVVLDDLWRRELLTENLARRVRVPRTERRTAERGVLTDFELARYLAWQNPDERHQVVVLEW